jgi:hypothetical protein
VDDGISNVEVVDGVTKNFAFVDVIASEVVVVLGGIHCVEVELGINVVVVIGDNCIEGCLSFGKQVHAQSHKFPLISFTIVYCFCPGIFVTFFCGVGNGPVEVTPGGMHTHAHEHWLPFITFLTVNSLIPFSWTCFLDNSNWRDKVISQ